MLRALTNSLRIFARRSAACITMCSLAAAILCGLIVNPETCRGFDAVLAVKVNSVAANPASSVDFPAFSGLQQATPTASPGFEPTPTAYQPTATGVPSRTASPTLVPTKTLVPTLTPTISYEVCPGYIIAGLPAVVTGDTSEAVNDYDPGIGGCASGFPQSGPDVVFTFYSVQAGLIRIVMTPEAGSDYDCSVYAVYDCANVAISCVGGVDEGLAGEQEVLDLVVHGYQQYHLIADGWSATESGAFTLSLEYQWFSTLTPTKTLTPTATWSPTWTPYVTSTPTAPPTKTPFLSPTPLLTLGPAATLTPTNTHEPTGTATLTPPVTASPTFTASETPTPGIAPTDTALPQPTPPATQIPGLGVRLLMPATEFSAGDEVWLRAYLANPAAPMTLNLVVLLDPGTGDYWFWPSWVQYPPVVDYVLTDVAPGITEIPVIEAFIWPSGGSAWGSLRFYAALMNLDLSSIIGEDAEWRFSVATDGL